MRPKLRIAGRAGPCPGWAYHVETRGAAACARLAVDNAHGYGHAGGTDIDHSVEAERPTRVLEAPGSHLARPGKKRGERGPAQLWTNRALVTRERVDRRALQRALVYLGTVRCLVTNSSLLRRLGASYDSVRVITWLQAGSSATPEAWVLTTAQLGHRTSTNRIVARSDRKRI